MNFKRKYLPAKLQIYKTYIFTYVRTFLCILLGKLYTFILLGILLRLATATATATATFGFEIYYVLMLLCAIMLYIATTKDQQQQQ